MKVLIIEDEITLAKNLGNMVISLLPQAVIVRYIGSVSMAVDYLSKSEIPDIIFMDIQLSDGNCFEIFNHVNINTPVIFCTAYDQYAIEAFKKNGIDYILKPIQKKDIQDAFNKIKNFQNFFQNSSFIDIENVLNSLITNKGKTNFLIFRQSKYCNIPIEQIAYFHSQYGGTLLITYDQKEYSVSKSLDEIGQLVSSKQFFRINRQYLINFTAVTEVEHYFSRKLLVKLKIPTSEVLLVTKDKATLFLRWLEER